MATKKPQHRDPKDILSEYSQVCLELGECVYRMEEALPRVIAELKSRALKLNEEHAAAVAAQSKENVSNGQ